MPDKQLSIGSILKEYKRNPNWLLYIAQDSRCRQRLQLGESFADDSLNSIRINMFLTH